MADGLAHLAPAGVVTRTLGGRELRFSVVTMGTLAEKEAYILALMPNPMAIIGTIPDNAPKYAQELIAAAAMKVAMRPAYVSRDEDQDFDASPHGAAWAAWRGLRDNHAEFGMWSDGCEVRHTVGTGANRRRYTMTPQQGVEACMALFEEIYLHDKSAKEKVAAALAEAEQKELLGNSAGPSPTSQNQTTTAESIAASPGV